MLGTYIEGTSLTKVVHPANAYAAVTQKNIVIYLLLLSSIQIVPATAAGHVKTFGSVQIIRFDT